MEDILASIKRIIADEPGAVPKPPQAASTAVPRVPSMAPPPRANASEPPPSWPRRAEPPAPPESVLDLTDRAPEAYRPRATPEPAAASEPPQVQRAVERLRQAEAELPPATPRPVPRDLLPRTPTPRPTGGDITLDALVREMLQPMLAEWIEKNLPDMVERMVQTEIRRMIDKEA